MSTAQAALAPTKPAPWYREPYTWLVFGLPAASIVLSLSLVVTAVKNRDPVLDRNAPMVPADQRRLQMMTPEQRATYLASLRPAREARNHAASPEVPPPRE
ncbi:MAG: hypothetical protein B7Y96_05370 [Comamonadaceae bacterium 32-67-11]|nr:MAG: hypothetical protein B7Y96_05370 [Comamonadaceae bacterium 32-67-11]